jgi:hypothetical protein
LQFLEELAVAEDSKKNSDKDEGKHSEIIAATTTELIS